MEESSQEEGSKSKYPLKEILGLLLLLALGLFIIRLSLVNKRQILPGTIKSPPLPVKVQMIKRQNWRPSVRLFGSVKPYQHYRAIAQVSGEVQWIHPALKGGAIIKAGEKILRIDPTDYELQLQKAQSTREEIEQRLKELSITENQLNNTISTEEISLELSLKEFHRQQELQKKDSTTQTLLDRAHQEHLTVKLRLDHQKNQLEIIPVRRVTLLAQLEAQDAAIQTANRLVERTVVSLPFHGRIHEFQLVKGQFLSQGQTILEADGITRVEVHTQISPRKMKLLLGGDEHSVRWGAEDFQNLVGPLSWDTRVQFVASQFSFAWDAKLDRIEGDIDTATRTLGLVFVVEEPWQNLQIGKKPPLIVGAHVKVLIQGLAYENVLAISRRSLHEGFIYLCNPGSKLEVRPVKVLTEHDDVALLEGGVENGESVVLTDISPAFPGRPLHCVSTEPPL